MSALSRRTLVRTGVTTAWTAPIMLMAVPASAAACSGGVVQLAAREVEGSRVVSFDEDSGRLLVSVTVRVTNSGVAGLLVSASVSGTNDDLMERFAIGRPGLGEIGSITVMGGTDILTVTAMPPVALPATQDFTIEYRVVEGQDLHTISVSFQPDCGVPAVCSFTTDV